MEEDDQGATGKYNNKAAAINKGEVVLTQRRKLINLFSASVSTLIQSNICYGFAILCYFPLEVNMYGRNLFCCVFSQRVLIRALNNCGVLIIG